MQTDKRPERNRIIAVACPSCGSTDVTRDAIARWDVRSQSWETSDSFDDRTCGDCGHEGDDFKAVVLDTSPECADLGLAIADCLEGQYFKVFGKLRHGEDLDRTEIDEARIDSIDRSDPETLVVTLDSGLQFTVAVRAAPRNPAPDGKERLLVTAEAVRDSAPIGAILEPGDTEGDPA